MNIEKITIIFSIISFIIALISLIWTFKTKKRYERVVMRLGGGEDLSKILDKYISDVSDVNKKDDQIIDYCNKINDDISRVVSRIGIIRYDAYSSTRNRLSFVIALLDKNNTGIVINSVYGIDSSNVYAKPVIRGRSTYNLSSEEIDAIKNASNNNLLTR